VVVKERVKAVIQPPPSICDRPKTTCPPEQLGLIRGMTAIACGDCETTLDEDASLDADERQPCPVCGSKARVTQLTAHAIIGVGATASVGVISGSVQSIRAISDLLLQAVIVAGDKTAEGRLIEAVAVPWFDIIELLKKAPNIAFQISPDKWEEIIAGAYHKAGFEEVTLTPRSGDYGRDVIAVKKGLGSIRVIDQVKAYRPGHLVTADDVRALVGVLQGDGASKGFLTTTSDFAPRLRTDPLITPLIPSRLGLIDGKALLARLEELARTAST
jgi:restriction system protein